MKSLSFKKISIEALGPFKGVQVVDLSIFNKKPMLLIEGMNGCGKTTFLLCLQIALFGRKIYSKLEKKTYESLIRELARKDVQTNPRICAEIEFTDVTGTHTYQVTRVWELRDKFYEKVIISKDVRTASISIQEWDELIDSYLPSELVDMFFFDGEKIEQMANPNRMPAILKKATEAFLGIHEIDVLNKDTLAFERRAITRMKSEDVNVDSDLLEFYRTKEEVKALEEQIERESIVFGEKQNILDVVKKAYDQFKIETERQGGVVYKQSISLRSKHETLSQELKEAKKKLIEATANQYLPLSRLSKLMDLLLSRYKQEELLHNSDQINTAILEHNKKLLDALLRALPLSHRVIKDVFRNKEASLIGKKNESQILVPMIPCEVLREKITQAVINRNNAQLAVFSLEDKLFNIQKFIDAIPPKEQVQLLLQEEQQFRTKLASAKLDVEFEKEKIHQLEGKLTRTRQHLNVVEDRLRSSYKGNAKIKAALDASKRVRSVLKIYKDCLLAHKAKWLSNSISIHYKRLMRKQSMVDSVQIDPDTYAVTVKLVSGDILPMSRLSAGERQLLATAVLSALIGERLCSFPVVVDTPLARLDRSHRSNMLRNFYATVSHQVVVLSTDEEISGKLKEEALPFIYRNYLFVYDDIRQCTNIEEVKL